MPTALIVEDEPEANKLLGMLVKLRGFQILSAFSGKDALRQIETGRPDVVLLDLMLPDLNGYEICKSLKSVRETSLLPVIIVTARIAAENRIECFAQGADDFIAKPYTPEHIFQALQRAGRWDALCHQDVVRGEITLDRKRDEGEILRLLGQLRSLVFARSGLSADQVHAIDAAIREALFAPHDRAGAPGDDVDRTLSYSLDQARLELRFRGSESWVRRIEGLSLDPCSAVYLAGFDRIEIDGMPPSAVLTRELTHAD
ncbi:response regulator transcription factor [Aquisphaera insulae]|uniref:response regulator transcription factor n=1 Tax=Aquisphaera insulae TaxID=2712864 RepID=UPI0013E9C0B2|nr:response regulator [Aquisphaera insulae]